MSAKKEAKKAWCYFDYESYIRPERKDDFKENIKRLSKEGKVCYKHLAGEDKLFLPCEYEILENGEIEVKVECYALTLEIENQCDEDGQECFVFGCYFFNQFERRDIFIFDGDKSFLLKKARAIRFPIIFSAIEYFISDNGAMSSADSLFKFFSKTKVKSIKIFAKTLNDFKGKDIIFRDTSYFKENYPKIFDKLKDKTYLKTFEQYKHREIFVRYNSCLVEVSYIFKESVNINKNNISKISVQIDNSPDSPSKYGVYIQIDLDEAVDPYKAYDDVGTDKVYDYLEEIAIYFQLFFPSKIEIDHVYTILEDVDQEVDTIIDDVRHEVKIIEDDNCFEFVTVDLQNFYDRVAMFNKSSLSAFSPTITGNILDFLKTCYDKIAYRTCDNYLRDIKHFIFEPSLLIENWFLCCFKFIEKFYRNLSNRREIIKKAIKEYDGDQNKEDIFLYCFKFTEKYYEDLKNNYKLIKRAIEEYYYEKDNESYGHKIIEKMREKYDDYADYIVKLRNHYVHEGYHLPKSGKLKEISLPDVYNDFLRLLQRIAMNIIFKSILGYESHEFPMLDEFLLTPRS